jgi:hypothetical protein
MLLMAGRLAVLGEWIKHQIIMQNVCATLVYPRWPLNTATAQFAGTVFK